MDLCLYVWSEYYSDGVVSKVLELFCDGSIKEAHDNNKKFEYGSHLQLINMDHINIIALLGNIL